MAPQVLENAADVISYLANLQGFSLPTIEGVSCPPAGKTNFVYRVNLARRENARPEGEEPLRGTIILKHAPPYAVDFPDMPLDTKRCAYEADALREVQSTKLGNVEVRVPTLLFHDMEASVLLMEDINPPSATSSSPPTLLSACFEQNEATVAEGGYVGIGEALGSWLYSLHQMGRGRDEARLRTLFEGHAEARKINAWWSFGSVLENLVTLHAEISDQDHETLKMKLKEMEVELAASKETLTMGDFRSANVFVASSQDTTDMTREPVTLTVLDWEFVTYGAPFFDLGHFAGEAWVKDRMLDPSAREGSASRLITSSLFNKYRGMGGTIEVERVVPLIAAYIASSLVNEKWATNDEEVKDIASAALQMVKTLEDGDMTRLKDDSFLNHVLY